MTYAPIGAHGWWCDDRDPQRMCDECRHQADWDEPDREGATP